MLTHDPGMYPKRLILDDARQCGIAILGLDVNASEKAYVVRAASRASLDRSPSPTACRRLRAAPGELGDPSSPTRPRLARRPGLGHPARPGRGQGHQRRRGRPDRRRHAPYHSLTDFWHRAQVSRPVVERLVLAGGFDRSTASARDGRLGGVRRRTKVTRRDLLLQVAELDRHARAVERAGRARGLARRSRGQAGAARRPRADEAADRASTDPTTRDAAAPVERHALASQGVWARAAAQSRAAADPRPVDLGPAHPRPRRRAAASTSAACPR